ncbi:MAG: zinc ABC transporter substrate-binding protein [Bacteroidales bacterium]|nr:zinc ABC transporter substrate-binding protein [Bacteroidales bacterium]
MKILKVLILLTLILPACNSPKENQPDIKKTITVSILPQKYFVEKIAGDHFNINVMIPPGASPVTYEPTPKQMKELSNSFVYFRIGHIEFEKSWMKKLMDINPDMQIVDLSKNATLIYPEQKVEAEHAHDHEGHHHHGIDPHIWTSPKEVKKQAKAIYDFLIKYDSGNNDEYSVNYKLFNDEVDSLDAYLREVLLPYKGLKFMIFHPALSYFARDYELEQISIETDGKEPTPAGIQKIIEVAKKENIRIVFVQKQFSTHNAEVIAKEIDGRVVQIDPLDYNWVESIKFIAEEIVKSYSN